MSKSSVVYADFKIEKKFNVSKNKVYEMFADKQSKELWFKGPSDSESEHSMDFRVGGNEYSSGKFHDGVTHVFKATYYDIVPNERIVYTYEMHLDDNRISVSVATIEFSEDNDQTMLVLHESGVFLDGYDKPENREYGSKLLLDSIETALAESKGE